MIEQSTTLFVSEGCEPTVRVTPGACIVQVAGGDVRIVGTPEHIFDWLQRVADAVGDAETENRAEQVEVDWTGNGQETRQYAAGHVHVGDNVLCPDGAYRRVTQAVRGNARRVVFTFADGEKWQGDFEDTVPVVIRTAERSA